jgi:hypothetical protein
MRIRLAGHVAYVSQTEIQCLIGERAGRKPLRMPAHGLEDNIKLNLQKEAK